MKIKLLHWKTNNLFSVIAINVIMVILYVVGVYFSRKFTTLHGEVASVWFASAITLPIVFVHDIKVFPGIILGSIIGLAPSLAKINPPLSSTELVFLQAMCALGNCLQPITARYLIKKFSYHKDIFAHIQSVYIFIISSIFTPIISAFIGVTTLLFINVISVDSYPKSFLTWWLASALAHLIFSPTIMQWREKNVINQQAKIWEILLITINLFLLCIVIFQFSYPVEYLLLPILIWIVFRLNRFYSSLFVSIISLVAIIATNQGYGVFFKDSVNVSLILLQSFLAMFSLTALILGAILSEKNMAKDELKNTLDTLEIKISERTKQLEESQFNLRRVNKKLERMATIDSLTQVANRGYFDRILHKEWNKLAKKQEYLCLLLMDVDYFKAYNDTYGHQKGDECLIKIAQCFQSIIRSSSDTVARYGGEEFVIILPSTNIDQGIVVAQKIQARINDLAITHESSLVSDKITISIGISCVIPHREESPEDLIQKADKSLYLAKKEGRNRYKIWSFQ